MSETPSLYKETEKYAKINLISLGICSLLSLVGIINGDTIDMVFGVYTLIIIFTASISFMVPWTVFFVQGIQITTFFFFSMGEVFHLFFLQGDYFERIYRVALIIIRMISYLVSGVIGVIYLSKVLKSSVEYTKYLSLQNQKKIVNKE
jgi:hypothetical protein